MLQELTITKKSKEFRKCKYPTRSLILIMTSGTPHMAPSPRHSGVQRISGFNIDSIDQLKMDTHGSSNDPTHDLSPLDRPSLFFSLIFMDLTLISPLSYLVTSSNLFLLSKTQLSSQFSLDPLQIPHYNLYSHFRSEGCVCA